MMTSSTAMSLESILRLNNQGTAMLASSNEGLSRRAMGLFRQALAAIDELDRKSSYNLFSGVAPTGMHMVNGMGPTMDDVCRFVTVPIAAGSDNATADGIFYFCRQAIYLNPTALAYCTLNGDSVASVLRLFLASVMLNTSLACYKAGSFLSLKGKYRVKAMDLFQRSAHLYNEVFHLYEAASEDGATDVTFLAMIATNNLSWIFLSLGYPSQAEHAQKQLAFLLDNECDCLTSSAAQETAQEFFLNTTILSMTAYLSELPAGAA